MPDTKKPNKLTEKAAREARLRKQLRANLHRRKDQSRGRDEGAKAETEARDQD